jgi:large subunit ribosomal protein L21e
VRSRGPRRKSRNILTKEPRKRGIQPLGRLLQRYQKGDKAVISIDPSFHKGMPHARYHGRVGVIEEKRGRSYVIKLDEGSKAKILTIRPEHLIPYPRG